MTQYEMVETLSEKMGVTFEKAKDALEASSWDMLDAALLLERERGESENAYSTEQAAPEPPKEKRGEGRRVLRSIGRAAARLVALGNRNRLEVRKGDKALLEVPVTALVVLVVFCFWIAVPLLVVGLFTGCRYRFTGPELGREAVNSAMDKAADTAEKVKADVRAEVRGESEREGD